MFNFFNINIVFVENEANLKTSSTQYFEYKVTKNTIKGQTMKFIISLNTIVRKLSLYELQLLDIKIFQFSLFNFFFKFRVTMKTEIPRIMENKIFGMA